MLGPRESGARSLIRALAAAALAIAACGALRPAHADLVVPSGSVTNLASGTVDLACTDVIVGGTLQVSSGAIVNARHVTIQPGGTIDGGSGTLTLGGNWTNGGSFIAGTGTIRFRDLCSAVSAAVAGNTTFSTASFVTATGKHYVFASGSTQTVGNLLEIAGTAAQPIQFLSSAAGNVAYIDLIAAGSQAIQHVGVTDVWATGQWLAPALTNEGGGGNANRWFGGGAPVVAVNIPTLSDAALAALASLLAATGAFLTRRKRSILGDSNQPRR